MKQSGKRVPRYGTALRVHALLPSPHIEEKLSVLVVYLGILTEPDKSTLVGSLGLLPTPLVALDIRKGEVRLGQGAVER